MDELNFFFFVDEPASSPIPTDYLQSDGAAPAASQPPDQYPYFDGDDVQVLSIADGYQQQDFPETSPTQDAWDHFDHACEEDCFAFNEPMLRANSAVQPPALQQEGWPFFHADDIWVHQQPDDYQQSDNINTAPHQVADVPFDFFDEHVAAPALPDDYQQTDNAAEVGRPHPDPFWQFDVPDIEFDELIIIDDANFTNSLERAFDFDFFHYAQEDHGDAGFDIAVSIQSLPTLPGAATIPYESPLFDGVDEDLDELIIIDDSNFTEPPRTPEEWDFTAHDLVDDWQLMPEGPVGPNNMPQAFSPATGVLTITGFVPQIIPVNTFSPQPWSPTLQGYAPDVQINRVIAPANQTLHIVGYMPTVIIPYSPTAGVLTITGYAPAVAIGRGIAVDAQILTLTGYAPVIGQPHSVLVPAALNTLQGYAPVITNFALISPTIAGLQVRGYAPTLAQPLSLIPATAVQVLVGYVPLLNQRDITPDPETLTLTTYAPTLIQLHTPQARRIIIEHEPRVIRPRAP